MLRMYFLFTVLAVSLSACGEPDSVAACPKEGATRVAACGFCGMVSEMCTNGAWKAQSECLGQAECAAATVEKEAGPMCGTQARTCDATCHWGAWIESKKGTGECGAGTERTAQLDCGEGYFRKQKCSDTCGWTTVAGECTDACGGKIRRTSPAEAEEICIPAGPFIRGAEIPLDQNPGTLPVREVTLSAYYIDRYPVILARYKDCMQAGRCSTPFYVGFTEAPYHPVINVTWEQAKDFCQWDGRRLLTEAEWEKAARGPAPRAPWFVWDDENKYRCDLFRSAACGAICPSDGTSPTDRYDSLPGTKSYYGVEMLMGGGPQWVSDYYDETYYAQDDSLIDPQGPPTGNEHVSRGMLRCVSKNSDRVVTRNIGGYAVRCGRSADAKE